MHFSSEGCVGELRNLRIPKKASNQNQTISPLAAMNWNGGILGYWECPWPNVVLENPRTPLPAAMGLFSVSSLPGQGSLIEPFGFIMILTVQYCLLF